VILANGDVLDIRRGETRARHGRFALQLSDRLCTVPVPTYRMPQVAKVSAGYFAAPEMDLIDLFIGSEGTLGVLTSVTLRVRPVRPAICLAFVPFEERDAALDFVAALRAQAQTAWAAHDGRGLDV